MSARRNTGTWRLQCAPGQVVYISPNEPMRFETEEDAKAAMSSAGWTGMCAVQLELGLAGTGRTSSRRSPADVARALVLEVIRRIEFYQTCDYCEAGQPDDDGGDKEHDEECPLYGYDHTKDVEALRAWAKEKDNGR